MMSFVRNFFKNKTQKLAIIAFVVVVLGVSSTVFAQIVNPNNPINPIRPGEMRGVVDIFGFAWMGTGIDNPTESEGGGGWLKFNCEPEYCEGTSRPWGVKMNLNPGRDQGTLTGEAWSNNYGWLSFDPNIVRSCWQSNPSTVNNVARVTDLNITDPSYGDTRQLTGWAKFIAGDDDPEDGWDGCVSFSGQNYGVFLDLVTGDLTGWAWGSDVVGWISFKNPECRYCDTSVLLPGTATVSFWAEDTIVPIGEGTVLHWKAIDTPSRRVTSCSYSNSNNYNHWMSSSSHSSNVGVISITVGNLPIGEHPIDNITQNTTYRLDCTASDGTIIPQKLVNIIVVEAIKGCMDPLAINYDPRATMPYIPDNCVYDANMPSVDLAIVTNFSPNFLPVGSSTPFDYQLSPRWTFTNPQRVAACTGNFFDDNGVERSLLGWSEANLAVPTVGNGYWVGPHSGTHNVGTFAAASSVNAGDTFIFRINCTDIDGNPFSASAEAVFQNMAPLVTDLSLEVEEDIFMVGSGSYDTGAITWSSSNPSLVEPNSCVGTFRVNSTLQTLSDWSEDQANPNQSIGNINLATFADSASDGTVFRFRITCQSTSGTVLTDEDTIIMDTVTVPPSPPPIVNLTLLTPPPAGNIQVLPDTGYIVQIGWRIENATSCQGSSQMIVNNIEDTNALWNGTTFVNTNLSTMDMDMVVGSSVYSYPTTFTITCVNEDGVSADDSVRVLIDERLCPPQFLPTCGPIPGSNIPGYEEF